MGTSESIFFPIALAFVMFGIGLNLHFSSFKSVFVQPKAVIFGVVGQLIILPAVAFLIAVLWPMDNVHKVGLILIAACPGGTSSNLVTFLLRGRLALSVTMTTVNSFFILVTIPLIIGLASKMFLGQEEQVEIGFWYLFSEILFTVLVPTLAGMVIHSWKPELTAKLRKPLRYVLPGILLTVFAIVLFDDSGDGVKDLISNWVLFFPALLLNVGSMLIGYYLASLIGIRHRGSYTIAVEIGLQNSVLAIFLATSVLQYEGLALMAVIYGSFSFFVTLGLGYLMMLRGEK